MATYELHVIHDNSESNRSSVKEWDPLLSSGNVELRSDYLAVHHDSASVKNKTESEPSLKRLKSSAC